VVQALRLPVTNPLGVLELARSPRPTPTTQPVHDTDTTLGHVAAVGACGVRVSGVTQHVVTWQGEGGLLEAYFSSSGRASA
jgi:hypothetical protein